MSTGDASYASALEGRVSGKGRRFVLVASRFNAHVTEPLLESAMKAETAGWGRPPAGAARR